MLKDKKGMLHYKPFIPRICLDCDGNIFHLTSCHSNCRVNVLPHSQPPLNQRGTNPHRPSVDAKLVEVLPCFTFSQACECRVGDTCSSVLRTTKMVNGSEFSPANMPSNRIYHADAHEAKDLIASGYRYLDVRMVEDFNEGHVDVESVFNIAYFIMTPEGRVKNPQFLEQVLSVCSKEDGLWNRGRSRLATVDLLNADFKHVRNMGGGYRSWHEAGLGVKKEA
ncbi:Rhodanese-like domain-containing protein 17 [Vitis vinifera]|uniref:Rhodanese-like domain-containing protein 17 n=1 Tax=Vitis vinifera TaxID=29760 RepID=A0A438EUW2_VITVI|nr:Rhodanese-like domain-containing protein 17 [Vitis vinifera]